MSGDRWVRSALAGIVCLALGVGCEQSSHRAVPPAPPPRPTAPETGPVATVDGRAVSLARFNLVFQARFPRGGARGPVAGAAAMRLKVAIARELVDDLLVDQAARRRSIRVDAKAVDAEVARLAHTFPSPVAYRAYVAGYPEQAAGVRRSARQRLLRDRLAGVSRKARVSLADARAYYEAHKSRYVHPAYLDAADLLLPVVKGDAAGLAAARAQALRLVTTARSPDVAFSDLVRAHSKGPTAQVGGALPGVTPKNADPAIYGALSHLRPGQIAGPVVAADGVHVLKLLRRRPAADTSFEQARPGIEASLRLRRRSDEVAALLVSLRAHAKIEDHLAERYAGLLTPPKQLRATPQGLSSSPTEAPAHVHPGGTGAAAGSSHGR